MSLRPSPLAWRHVSPLEAINYFKIALSRQAVEKRSHFRFKHSLFVVFKVFIHRNGHIFGVSDFIETQRFTDVVQLDNIPFWLGYVARRNLISGQLEMVGSMPFLNATEYRYLCKRLSRL